MTDLAPIPILASVLALAVGCIAAPTTRGGLEDRIYRPRSKCRSVLDAVRELRDTKAVEIEVCVNGLLASGWEGERTFIEYAPGLDMRCLADAPEDCPGPFWKDDLLPDRSSRRLWSHLDQRHPVVEVHGVGLVRKEDFTPPGWHAYRSDTAFYLTRIDAVRALGLDERQILAGNADEDED